MNPTSSPIRASSDSFLQITARWLSVCFIVAWVLPPAMGVPITFQNDLPDDYARAEALVRRGQWDAGIAALKPLLASKPDLKIINLMGLALTGKGDLKDADARFEQALRISPLFLPAMKNLAINEFNLGQLDASEQHLSTALRLAPEDPVIHGYLGEIAFRRKEYSRATKYLSRGGRLLTMEPDLAAHLAISELEEGRLRKALRSLNEIDIDRLSARSQFDLGYALAQHGFFTQALPYFNAVLRSYPGSYAAGFNVAVCSVEAKDYPRAIAVLNALLQQGHKTMELENVLAQAYESNHQTKQAIAALQEAIHISPEDEDNYVDLVTLCVDHDAYDLGMEVLNVGLHYHPNSARLIFQRGVLYAIHDEFSRANNDFELASRLAPDKNYSYIGMGVNSIQTGDLQRAIQVLRKRIREKPRDFMLQYLFGRTLLQSGANPGDKNFGEAQTALETSLELNPNFAASQVELAKVDLKENHLHDAIVRLEKAVALDPRSTAAYFQLVIAYRREGKPDLEKKAIDSLTLLNKEAQMGSQGGVHLVKAGPATPSPTDSH